MKIFLSAASSEFKNCRDALARDLRAVGAEVVVQEDFQQHGRTLLEKLEGYIAGCDRVIALAGQAYGWEPDGAALPGKPRRSYTQWEYFFAQGERLDGPHRGAKDTYVYFASPDFLQKNPVSQLPDAAALQEQFVAGIRASGKDYSAFSSLDELRINVLRDGFHLADRASAGTPQPELILELFDLSASNRFFYGARRVPFVGREKELDGLQNFLEGDARFQWWLMCGPAGVGKRRTALELCLRAAAWQAGWLMNLDTFNEWSTWLPHAPTLMVVEDAAAKAETVRRMIVSLFRRTDTLNHPVRVLLLEREARGSWYERFSGSGAERHSLDASQFEHPFELQGLDDQESWELIRRVVETEGGKPPDPAKSVAAFRRIDRQQRPLFASFAADAIVAGRDIEQWDQKELLGSVLKDELARWKLAEVTDADKNLLAVATMIGGLPLVTLKNPPVEGFLPPPREYSSERYRLMSGRPGESSLSPLAPSVLGAFFVLEHLKPSSDLDERAELARTAALAIDGGAYLRFFESAAHNLPGHPVLTRLRVPPPADQDAQVNWGFDAVNLIESLEEQENIALCRAIYDDVRKMASEAARTGLATLRYRIALTASQIILRVIQEPDWPEAIRFYNDLRTMAAADEDLKQQWINGGAALVLGLAGHGRLPDGAKLYDELRSAVDATEDKSSLTPSLAMAAGGLSIESAKAGNFTAAREYYEELRTHADYEHEAAPDRHPTRFSVQENGLGRVEFGQRSWESELREEQVRVATRLIETYIESDDLPSAQLLYGELKTLSAMYGPQPDSAAATAADQSQSRAQDVFGNLVLGLLDMSFQPLAGKHFTLFPEKHADIGRNVRKQQAYAAFLLLKAYAINKNLPLAQSMYDEFTGISLADPAAVPRKARAQAVYGLFKTYEQAGDDAAAQELVRGAADFLREEETQAAIADQHGEPAAEAFYRLVDRIVPDPSATTS